MEGSSPSKLVVYKRQKKDGSLVKKDKITEDQKKDVAEQSSSFGSKCSGHKLCKLANELNEAQKQAIEEIGFGGLLKMNLSRTLNTMSSWLVECFNSTSCVFSVTPFKEFRVTSFDVYDILCLPLNTSKNVVEISRGKNEGNPNFHFKMGWRQYFGVTNPNGQISLKVVHSKLLELVDGGDTFKKLFVMYAFSSFLAPTASGILDLRLAMAVDNVSEIKSLNWSKYVLERLRAATKLYKEQKCRTEKTDNFGGCIVLLQLMYFHHINAYDTTIPDTLPLIQHWDNGKVFNRIKLECECGEYGKGLLDNKYPISENYLFKDGQMDPTRLAGKVIVPIMEHPSIPEDVIPRLMGPTISGGEAGSAHQEAQTEAPPC